MKKHFFSALFFAGLSYGSLQAQNTFPASGNVGIGTTTPLSPLTIDGIGKGGADNILFLKDDQSLNMDIHSCYIGDRSDIYRGSFAYGVRPANKAWQIWHVDPSRGWQNFLHVSNNGNIGLGTLNPNSRLCVSDGGNGLISMNAGVVSALGFNRNVTDGAIPNPAISGWQFTARDESFHLEGFNGAYTFPLSILKNGYIGIGKPNPNSRLCISDGGNGLLSMDTGSESTSIGFNRNVTDGAIPNPAISGWQFTARDGSFRLEGYNGAFGNPLTVFKDGNIGIGTDYAGSFKLAVEGKIGAREVLVTTAPWADFVFKPFYKLPSLAEVESYIKANGHLPSVPSEEQIAKEGNDLAKTDAILLQKIEELTLYMIEKDKQIATQQAQIEALTRLVTQLAEKK